MAKIKWTPQALDDVAAIANFIARDSVYYAGIFTVKTFEAVERLELFTESGRIVPELNRKEIREIILGDYRIIYRVKEDIVVHFPRNSGHTERLGLQYNHITLEV